MSEEIKPFVHSFEDIEKHYPQVIERLEGITTVKEWNEARVDIIEMDVNPSLVNYLDVSGAIRRYVAIDKTNRRFHK